MMNRSLIAVLGIIVFGVLMYFLFQQSATVRALRTILEEAPIFSVEESPLNSPDNEQEQEVFGGTQTNMAVTEGTAEASPPQYPEGSFGAFLDSLDRKMTSLQLQARMENLEGETMDWEVRVSHVGESLSQLSVVIRHPDEPDSIGLSRQGLLFFSKSHKEELLKLNKGDIIKVRCKFQEMWYGGAHMGDCELL